MPASTALLTDIGTVITNGPSANTKTAANAAAGPVQDVLGNAKLVQLKLQESKILLTALLANTSNSDDATNRGLVNGVLAAINGTSTPSATVITDIKTIFTSGPSALTQAASIAAAGAIMDYQGNMRGVRRKLEECFILLTTVKAVTNASDDSANLALVNNLLTTLS